jgi:MFS family permease
LPDGEAVTAVEGRASAVGTAVPQALRQSAFWTLTLSSTLGLLAISALFAHQVPYVISRGYDPVLAAGLAGLVGVASLPGRFIFNVLSDRLGPQGLLALCGFIQALGVVILVVASSLAVLVAYAAVYGLAFGAISPLRASVMAEHFGRRSYGAITALQGLPVAIGAATGPLVAGWLYDRLGDYALALWLCSAAFLASAVLVVLTPRAPARGESARAPFAAGA